MDAGATERREVTKEADMTTAMSVISAWWHAWKRVISQDARVAEAGETESVFRTALHRSLEMLRPIDIPSHRSIGQLFCLNFPSARTLYSNSENTSQKMASQTAAHAREGQKSPQPLFR